MYRNYVIAYVNPYNEIEQSNGLFALGSSLSLKLFRGCYLMADHYYTFSSFRKMNSQRPYHNPFGIGIAYSYRKNLFNFHFSNTAGMVENDFIPNSAGDMANKEMRIGFSYTRILALKK